MLQTAAHLLRSIPLILGEKNWEADFLYFNSGSWDNWELRVNGSYNGNYSQVDADYARLLDLIASTCRPERQVCALLSGA